MLEERSAIVGQLSLFDPLDTVFRGCSVSEQLRPHFEVQLAMSNCRGHVQLSPGVLVASQCKVRITRLGFNGMVVAKRM